MKKKTIVFTGGGTLGHVMPNLYLIDELKDDYDIFYIGSNGVEKDAASKVADFFPIPAIKLERGKIFANLKIPFVLINSILKAKKILKNIAPDVVFSKGGYVALPVCIAAKMLKIPIIAHESDYSFGLANKIILKVCNTMCVNFKNLEGKNKKIVYTGPIFSREFENNKKQNFGGIDFNFENNKKQIGKNINSANEDLNNGNLKNNNNENSKNSKNLNTNDEKISNNNTNLKNTGNKNEGKSLNDIKNLIQHLNLDSGKPTILFVGGSLGSKKINDCLFPIVKDLIKNFNIIHLTGKGNNTLKSHDNYIAFESCSDMVGLYNIADFVVGRSGAGVSAECFYKRLPMLLIPLENKASRGDQLLNANYYKNLGVAEIVRETALTPTSLLSAIKDFNKNLSKYKSAYKSQPHVNGKQKIIELIKKY